MNAIDELVTAECARGMITIKRRGDYMGREIDWSYRVLELDGLSARGFWLNYGNAWEQRHDVKPITAYERRQIVEQALAQIKRRALPLDGPGLRAQSWSSAAASADANPYAPSGNRMRVTRDEKGKRIV